MTQNLGLNQAQMDFLRLLAHFTKEEDVKELNDLVCEYYARKVDEEMDKLWDEGKCGLFHCDPVCRSDGSGLCKSDDGAYACLDDHYRGRKS